ncbi:MAG: hypothetical protein QG587_1095 [Chloroflexota bacterium]|nr:hypothetical protein [Chloroflexota bacterium]
MRRTAEVYSTRHAPCGVRKRTSIGDDLRYARGTMPKKKKPADDHAVTFVDSLEDFRGDSLAADPSRPIVHQSAVVCAATIGDLAVIEAHATICDGATVQAGAIVQAGAMIGTGAVVEAGAVVGANAVVEAGAVVRRRTFVPPCSIVAKRRPQAE